MNLGIAITSFAFFLGTWSAGFAQTLPVESGAKARNEDAIEAPDLGTIDRWIADLNADRFADREQASRNLREAGPGAFERLAESADGRDVESAARAAAILETWSRDDDPERALTALELLSNLRNQPAIRRRAIERLAAVLEQRALARLTQVGARVTDRYFVPGRSEQAPLKIVFGETWRGDHAEFQEIRYLPTVRLVSIYQPGFTADDLAVFAEMPALSKVELFGAELTPDDVARLKKTAPHVEVDVRLGAMLGVGGGAGGGPAVIDRIEPDTAAERAGLQTGDVIHAINGKPVADFGELTIEIGKFKPGETVTLEYERDGERATMDVAFGRWK